MKRKLRPPQRLWILLATLAVVVVGAKVAADVTQPGDEAVFQRTAAFRASQPRMLQSIPFQKTPRGLPNLHAKTCGACHVDIYKEWQLSTHAKALHGDPQFIAEVHKNNTGKQAGWVCMNCHTPLENQQKNLVVAIVDDTYGKPVTEPNPHYDAALEQEAITCATCHVRDGVVLGPFGDTKAPHPTKKWPDLQASSTCTQCHQANATLPNDSLMCAFTTGDEAQKASSQTCQECHMPAVTRPLMPGRKARPTRRHYFMGSLLPKTPQDAAAIDGVRHLFKQGLKVTMPTQAKRQGGQLVVDVVYENAHAGHLLPTGDPERFLRIDVDVIAMNGQRLLHKEVRIGTVYQWDPEPKKLADNRLKAKERRTLQVAMPDPGDDVTVHVKVTKGRISQANLRYHHLEDKVVGEQVVFDDKVVLH